MSTYTVLRRIGWRRLPDAWIGDQFMYHVPKDYCEIASYSGKANYPVPAIYQPGLEREADGTCYHAMTDCRDPIYVAWFNSI